MLAATIVPLCFCAGSIAIDFASAIAMKNHLQAAADGAAIATASQLAQKKITADTAKAYAENFFNGVASENTRLFPDFNATATATITPDDSAGYRVWQVTVAASGSKSLTPMAHFLGNDSINIRVSGTSEAGQNTNNPLSMMLVLDHSGSMGWGSGQYIEEEVEKDCRWYDCGTETVTRELSKMEALQRGVESLVTQIAEADSEAKYARLGAVAYNIETTDSDKLPMTWDKAEITRFANDLRATGGTNPYYAFKWAYEKITSTTEPNAHITKNGHDDPSLFIVFMTDGETDTGNDWLDSYIDRQTKAYCEAAKTKGVVIYSVAFQAPEAGRELLNACASGADHYYDARSADDLIQAFAEIGAKAADLTVRLTR